MTHVNSAYCHFLSLAATNVAIKGQMVSLGAGLDHLIFIGSPRLTSLSELQEKNLFLSDIPLYDVTRELVLLNQQRIAEIEIRCVSQAE